MSDALGLHVADTKTQRFDVTVSRTNQRHLTAKAIRFKRSLSLNPSQINN